LIVSCRQKFKNEFLLVLHRAKPHPYCRLWLLGLRISSLKPLPLWLPSPLLLCFFSVIYFLP
jgi:hypothetical protein